MNAAPDLAAVKLALRIDTDETDAQLSRNIAAATELANRQAPGAPESVTHEATIRCVGWLFEGPAADAGTPQAGAWRRSGAEGLLAPWTVRRAGAISTREAAPPVAPPDEETTMPTARFFTVDLVLNVSAFPQVQAWTAQQWFDAADEVPGVTRRAVSVAAPIYCHQAAHHFTASVQYVWGVAAIADGDDPPSHFRLSDDVQPDNWATRWRQAGGQAVDGVAYDVYWWPVVFTAFPATVTLEWPA